MCGRKGNDQMQKQNTMMKTAKKKKSYSNNVNNNNREVKRRSGEQRDKKETHLAIINERVMFHILSSYQRLSWIRMPFIASTHIIMARAYFSNFWILLFFIIINIPENHSKKNSVADCYFASSLQWTLSRCIIKTQIWQKKCKRNTTTTTTKNDNLVTMGGQKERERQRLNKR